MEVCISTSVGSVYDRMDRMYRYQRHIYDLTRKYYLLGRDQMLDRLPLEPGESLCEIGCGTGRNLLRLGKGHPAVDLYGLDPSEPMLRSARIALRRADLDRRVRLGRGTAQDFNRHALFGREAPFDHVLFSYSLSMMNDWRSAIEHARANLRQGGSIHIVDFGDLAGLPRRFRRGLLTWLALFGTHPRPEIATYLANLIAREGGHLTRERVAGGYAQRLSFRAG